MRLPRPKLTLAVPEGQSILEVLRENGIEVDSCCEQGICGTCLTLVLGGVPDHCDTFLTASEQEENAVIAICVSRAKSRRRVLNL